MKLRTLLILLTIIAVAAGVLVWRYGERTYQLMQGVAPLVAPPPPIGSLLGPALLQERQEATPASGVSESTVATVANGGDNLPLAMPDFLGVTLFADDLSGPRDIAFSPDGVPLVSLPGEGKIVALLDRDNDGRSDETKLIAERLSRPHGLAFLGNTLLVAEETRLSRWEWDPDTDTARFVKKLADLPRGGRHVTRTIAIEPNGTVYVSLGSTCDVCVEQNPWIAVIIITDIDGTQPRVYARGLRNSVFITLKPGTTQLWGTEMGRDQLGDNLPPDEVNLITDGRDYGWPFCYGDRVWDQNFGQGSAAGCAATQPPVFEIPAHSAPLGLAFIDSPVFPEDWQGDLLVAYHGSWNRTIPTGYKMVRIDLEEKRAENVVTGWMNNGKVWGRPADVQFGPDGALYVSDDRAGAVYRFARR